MITAPSTLLAALGSCCIVAVSLSNLPQPAAAASLEELLPSPLTLVLATGASPQIMAVKSPFSATSVAAPMISSVESSAIASAAP